MIRTAIMVDSAFYQKRANFLFGPKTGQERADELYEYCKRHLKDRSIGAEDKYLYRIFVYDCHPSEKTIMHPLTQKAYGSREQTSIHGQMHFMPRWHPNVKLHCVWANCWKAPPDMC